MIFFFNSSEKSAYTLLHEFTTAVSSSSKFNLSRPVPTRKATPSTSNKGTKLETPGEFIVMALFSTNTCPYPSNNLRWQFLKASIVFPAIASASSGIEKVNKSSQANNAVFWLNSKELKAFSRMDVSSLSSKTYKYLKNIERKQASSSCTDSPSKIRAPRIHTVSRSWSSEYPSKHNLSSRSLTNFTRALKQSKILGQLLFNVWYTRSTSPCTGKRCNLELRRTIVKIVIHTNDFLYK